MAGEGGGLADQPGPCLPTQVCVVEPAGFGPPTGVAGRTRFGSDLGEMPRVEISGVCGVVLPSTVTMGLSKAD
jgi:hypothetical protein